MDVLKKLTIKNIKLNKKRSIGTIIGIILSVALICGVSTLITSFRQTLVQNAINEYGYYHLSISNITENDYNELKQNRDIENINTLYSLGHAYLDFAPEDSPYIEIYSASQKDIENLSYNLIDGRLPQNENEIVISNKTSFDGNYKIGDTITYEIGNRQTTDGYELNENNPYLEENQEVLVNTKTKTYRIVGICHRERESHKYYGITTNEYNGELTAYISLKKPKEYETSITEILGADSYKNVQMMNMNSNLKYQDYIVNQELLRWEVFAFSDNTVGMLYAVASVLLFIIVVTSVFCIKNSFAISTTEKMKMYGMLASVGATKKQIKKSVIFEGIVLGLIGIPIGIICGLLAIFVLLKVVNLLLGDFLFNSVDGILFSVSFFAIIISIILAYITIYFSAISSAKKAAKVSPIENLRNSKDIKIKSKKLKTPKIINKLFNVGGVLAYKNLKRSKKKYRTTVISLTVSIFAFISMNAFINEGFKTTAASYYKIYDYNVQVYGSISEYSDDEIEKLRNLDNIEKSYLTYVLKNHSTIKITDKEMINDVQDDINSQLEGELEESYLQIIGMDDNTFRNYMDKIGENYDDLKDKSILVDHYQYYSQNDNKLNIVRRYNYKEKDIINTSLADNSAIFKSEIGKISEIRPYGLENVYYEGGYLVVNIDYYNQFEYHPYMLTINSDNSEQLVKNIEAIDMDIDIFDIDSQVKAERAIVTVISIFLYGFIAVITLIGVTNIFNTITSNMELRSKEFAMLKSVGMTKKEFNRMVNLETIFYSSKSLFYGIILGILGSYAIHKALSENIISAFNLPITAISISIIFVFIIVYIIMKYSLSKINKQNTIETIRKDNI